jgi:CBS-domain-containing membrane protein
MSIKVRDCMNPQLVYLREGSRPGVALHPILDFGVTAVPVLDEDDRPIGVVSLRDIVNPKLATVRATRPAVCVGVEEPIEDGGRALLEGGVHHVVVIDATGRAVGMLSSLDVVRGLLGEAAKHPDSIRTFRAPDAASG